MAQEVVNLLEEIALENIILKPEKYRHFDLDEEGIDKLTEDIRSKGLLVPVLIWRKERQDFLISGYHRFEAAKRLKWKQIPARIMFFATENQAIEASVQTNAQDQYTFAKRSWFHRFAIAENVLRSIYEEKARLRQTSGTKADVKARVDTLLARGVGLSWSYVKYAQMRKIYQLIDVNQDKIEASIQECLKKIDDPKINLWLEVLQMRHDNIVAEKDWSHFVILCKEAAQKENAEYFSKVDSCLRYLRRVPLKKKQEVSNNDTNGVLYIAWKDKEGEKVLEEIKKLCKEKKWDIKIDGKTKKEVDTYSQKIIFCYKEEES